MANLTSQPGVLRRWDLTSVGSIRYALRVAIALNWALFAAAVALSYVFESSLPESLRQYQESEPAQNLTAFDAALTVSGLLAIILMLAASVGLFLFRRWALWLYVPATAVLFGVGLFFGPIVEHPAPILLEDLATMAIGVILGLGLFTRALHPLESPRKSDYLAFKL